MKLLAQTNRIYFAFSLVIYLLTALAFYQIIRYLIYDEVETRLQIEKQDFEAYIRTHDTWSSSPYFVENKIEIMPVSNRPVEGDVLTDTLILNRYDNEVTPFRQLAFYAPIKGQLYRVEIRKSLIQTFRLIEAITLAMLLFLGLLLLGTFWFQSRLSGRLWHPFYDTLSRIKGFDIRQSSPLQLEPSSITEFTELNDVFNKMADKMQHDYRSLKEFTENASHEMQTPLALINAKVEQLIQSEQLTQEQTTWIEAIYQASRRMARLNQGLLLLAKIENHQFVDAQPINLTHELMQRLTDMEEVLHHKEITIRAEVNPDQAFYATLPAFLAESLLSNLVSNAIRHNYPGGRIEVQSYTHLLSLSNTGPAPVTDTAALFQRFKKETSVQESVGLGLAIVKQIGDTYGLTVRYQFASGLHTITLTQASVQSAFTESAHGSDNR
ncbi:sensor histidine kinase [Spirosoma sp. KUDC1026]|uniref:sensor histidine kinase n=1 Tax=Spirosoma sp. KUDC1026 TaxID=2745947 RepID=UPI00159BE144|nr:HAMP domain-containing sensor histidine kinase [Spirosoma sp. KUDC1026]QKZ13572.1 HAMP domain-containing histidine kinase [Spirosoma sp. KUDC1026]